MEVFPPQDLCSCCSTCAVLLCQLLFCPVNFGCSAESDFLQEVPPPPAPDEVPPRPPGPGSIRVGAGDCHDPGHPPLPLRGPPCCGLRTELAVLLSEQLQDDEVHEWTERGSSLRIPPLFRTRGHFAHSGVWGSARRRCVSHRRPVAARTPLARAPARHHPSSQRPVYRGGKEESRWACADRQPEIARSGSHKCATSGRKGACTCICGHMQRNVGRAPQQRGRTGCWGPGREQDAGFATGPI